jgi:hypothetical protein
MHCRRASINQALVSVDRWHREILGGFWLQTCLLAAISEQKTDAEEQQARKGGGKIMRG